MLHGSSFLDDGGQFDSKQGPGCDAFMTTARGSADATDADTGALTGRGVAAAGDARGGSGACDLTASLPLPGLSTRTARWNPQAACQGDGKENASSLVSALPALVIFQVVGGLKTVVADPKPLTESLQDLA